MTTLTLTFPGSSTPLVVITYDETAPYPQCRDHVLGQLTASPWLAGRNNNDPIMQAIAKLAATQSEQEGDDLWAQITAGIRVERTRT